MRVYGQDLDRQSLARLSGDLSALGALVVLVFLPARSAEGAFDDAEARDAELFGGPGDHDDLGLAGAEA